MNNRWEYANDGCIDQDMLDDSSGMLVSDADDDDDDDDSFLGANHARLTGNNDTNSNLGASSFHTSSSTIIMSSVNDEPHQITPQLQDSKNILAGTTNTTNGSTTSTISTRSTINLPFCPRISTDERKTAHTIQSRVHCAQDSPKKLVDEYRSQQQEKVEFKYDCRYESIRRHDFNACRTSRPEGPQRTIGIHKNLIDLNQLPMTNSHKIADSLSGTPNLNNISNNYNSITSLHQNQNQLVPHKISSDEDIYNNNTNIMPSNASNCLPRQRSRGIAIKRSRPGDNFIDASDAGDRDAFVDNEARRCDVELYDYATWRMYNRIIDHRRKNLLRSHHQDDHDRSQDQQHDGHVLTNNQSSTSSQASASSAIDEQHGRGMVHPSSMMNGQRYYVHNNAPFSGDDYLSCSEDEDEIFDLEL